MRPIYLDHNASAPLDPEVLEAMRPHWLAPGNPGSRHGLARGPRRALDQARETIARILNAEPSEVVFTSGGTEANNLAIFGLAGGIGGRGGAGSLVSSPIEHPAVAEPVSRLEAEGYEVGRGVVSSDGRVTIGSMLDRIDPGTRLATLILAHNETGVLQDVALLADQAGVPVHTDAVQAVGRIPVDFKRLGVATLAASAHKFHGPVGVGVLLVRTGCRMEPMLLGGGQQGGRRPGTQAVALAVGMAAALGRWHREAGARIERWLALKRRLEGAIVAGLGRDAVVTTGPIGPGATLPQTLHLGFPGLDGDALLMQLDLAGVSASLGSACASGSTSASPSLVAMGVPADRLRSSVRFSMGAGTTEDEVDEAARRVVAVVRGVAEAGGGIPGLPGRPRE
ncbi:cysteine desulfurase family protein [Tautonia plasticadhaerens]|uniref:Cysteine desulfurase n=1 Tax=Tautonia plasticadhaerens TaxID=2527974 RepID=A0A518H945_9BACT|nr:cysteine desulfurase family protein [Tautonia plasticadhaerens]QDV37364.1 Cysteine desulfurase [Tautonia plasticadhaerens]